MIPPENAALALRFGTAKICTRTVDVLVQILYFIQKKNELIQRTGTDCTNIISETGTRITTTRTVLNPRLNGAGRTVWYRYGTVRQLSNRYMHKHK